MDPAALNDRLQRGLGQAARHLGGPYDAYRPAGPAAPLAPLAPANRFLRLHASFSAGAPGYRKPALPGHPLWCGLFDAAYTQPGDYLVGEIGTLFVAAQPPLSPVLCVLANRTLSFTRPAAPAAAGINAYGGDVPGSARLLCSGWPASVVAAANATSGPARLPTDAPMPRFTVLLPAACAMLRTGDVMQDDLGHGCIVSAAELSATGWRLMVREVVS